MPTSQLMTMLVFLIILVHIALVSSLNLRPGYYSETCPEAEFIVRDVMKRALMREPRSVASVMRFQFHDCFVNGCDGSMLLDDTPTMLGEKLSLSNINSLRSYEVVDEIKEALEKACPGVVSCADIIIMASRDAVALFSDMKNLYNQTFRLLREVSCGRDEDGFVLVATSKLPHRKRVLDSVLYVLEPRPMARGDASVADPVSLEFVPFIQERTLRSSGVTGGPDWEVRLGRLDSLTASQEDADNIMPSPRANATTLIDLFHRFNLSIKDLVALSGSHSIGEGRCFSIMFRLYNQSGTGKPDPAINPIFREELYKRCPLDVDQNTTVELDSTPRLFDNQYFKDLVAGRGFLNSDETLFTFPLTKKFVKLYSKGQDEFFRDFVEGMLKMGDLQSGQPGEIRRNCRVVNSVADHLVVGLQNRMESNHKSI